LLPEYFCLMGKAEGDKLVLAEADGTGPIQSFLSELAKQHSVTLIAGTIPLVADHPNKIRNSTLVYGSDGQRLSRYDKIHLFRYRNEKESYDEAHTIEAGAVPVKFELDGLEIGLSVCYDLRFPELYRRLLPIDMLVVPAAFTYTTGKAHWELLLRARAVENQCYVLACGQGGAHTNGRTTYGHSMLIDPWGHIVDCLPEGQGLVICDLERATLNRVRAQLPALQHRVLC
jgi:nitrilase